MLSLVFGMTCEFVDTLMVIDYDTCVNCYVTKGQDVAERLPISQSC
ncbi:hypothetical protein MiSe_94680 [Microseira wollei NIES-4236]|uniref:Uncharacterized protein n=1 Tax=Microseira wollei NIES-4236 TaxID=2530354 RepID=A0AAV3XUQ7_9CYAN|nr:hypothetical protein MiSe_94680 [Microseira wollei NIES-4236]